jgi:hypothetical protein
MGKTSINTFYPVFAARSCRKEQRKNPQLISCKTGLAGFARLIFRVMEMFFVPQGRGHAGLLSSDAPPLLLHADHMTRTSKVSENFRLHTDKSVFF